MSDPRVELEVVIRPSDKDAERCETRGHFWLSSGRAVVVGRSVRDADLPIEDDPSLSKRHFSVAFDGQRCRLVDLASKNGTMVNGARVTAIDLHHGDVVCAGQTVFRVSVVPTGPEQAPEQKEETTVLTAERPIKSVALAKSPATDSSATDISEAEPEEDALFLTLTVTQTPSVSSDDLRASRTMAWIRAGQTVVVGRTAWQSDWTFRGDERMSAKHFSVTCDGRKCYLNDLESANGTLLNQVPVAHAELADGDRIQAGQTEFAAQILGRE